MLDATAPRMPCETAARDGYSRRWRRARDLARPYVNAVDDGACAESLSTFHADRVRTVQCKNSLVFGVTRVCAEIVPLRQVTN